MMKKPLLPLLLLASVLSARSAGEVPEMAKDFNFGWRFAKGAQAAAIAGDFDDSAWETVDLPHDWAISGPFGAPKEEGRTGKLPWIGEGVYRKHFELPAEARGKRLQLIFDGVMASPKVYLNGKEVGSWTYGYNSFWIDATEAANFGGENVLTVHADTREHGSRWYPGAGIYRKVSLRIVDPLHIPVWGVFVTAPEIDESRAKIDTRVEVTNAGLSGGEVQVEVVIVDPNGNEVAVASQQPSVGAGATVPLALTVEVPSPMLWDIETPRLYMAISRILRDGKVAQEERTLFGLRQFKWTADDGFHLNGRRVQLHGVNLHHDQGPLGAAFFPRAMERQLQIMKNMGVNAIRTSHNAPAPELLDLCDRMGFVVWDELFDKYGPTAGVDCSIDEYVDKHAEREVVNFMRRDRNHPSVFIWSIGNEIGDLKEGHVDKMVSYFKKQDTTRPTSLGSHIPNQAHKVINSLDTSGWNYAQKYMTAREAHPEKPLIYSETASAFGTRGAYKLNLPKAKTDWGKDGELNAFVLTSATWSDIPELEFDRMIKHPFVAGEFVWTGFDYLGEPTPFPTSRSSYFGIVDLVGLPKDSYYLYRSHWLPDVPTVHLSPHWNWQGREGQPVPVFVYTNGDEAELFLNGKSLGRKKKVKMADMASENLAFGKVTSASSEELKQDAGGNVQAENLSGKAVDGNPKTFWCASDGKFPQYWQVDMETPEVISSVTIQWGEKDAKRGFEVLTSLDGRNWTPVATKASPKEWKTELNFEKRQARWVRVEIKKGSKWAVIRELQVRAESLGSNAETNPYFKIVDAYRIRWLDVPYSPGELKAVAYKGGEKIGETLVRTAGEGTTLCLTSDRPSIKGDGMDLSYITVEMVDANGVLCPLAMDDLKFDVSGPANFVAAGNGDQRGHDSFTDDTHPLFYGKAMAILRSVRGGSGAATLSVSSESGLKAQLVIQVSAD